jgi:hypothetical protein
MERIVRMAAHLVKLINPFLLIDYVNNTISGMRFQIYHCDQLGRMIVTLSMTLSMPLAMTLAIFMTIMRIRRQFNQVARNPVGDGFVGIGFRCDQGGDALLLQAILQSRPQATGDQQSDVIQRVRRVVVAFMKALRKREFQQMFFPHATVFNLIHPELAAFSGVLGDGLAVLAGDGDFHLDPPCG